MHLKLLFLLCTKEPLSETQENRLTQMPTKNRTKLIGRNRENGNRVVCSYLSTYVQCVRGKQLTRKAHNSEGIIEANYLVVFRLHGECEFS